MKAPFSLTLWRLLRLFWRSSNLNFLTRSLWFFKPIYQIWSLQRNALMAARDRNNPTSHVPLNFSVLIMESITSSVWVSLMLKIFLSRDSRMARSSVQTVSIITLTWKILKRGSMVSFQSTEDKSLFWVRLFHSTLSKIR